MREPVVLRLEKRPIDLKEYRLRKAQESDYEQLITESTVVVDGPTDRVSIVYLELDDDCTDVVEVIRQVRYDSVAERAGGMLSQSRIFGYRPRITIRDDFCTVSALAHENPLAHGLVSSYAEKVSRYYEQFNPELYTKHAQAVDKVLPDWKIEQSVFTSGIINKNNPLPYHFDAGNFKDVWSNMLVFKQDVQGGYLAVPEYNVGFEVKHNSLLMFDGQNILHGVTPIYLLSDASFRYSIVYYSLQSMWKCLPPEQEVERIQKVRTEREYRRLENTRKKEQAEREGANAADA